MKKANFITFEGPEGAGKTTAIQAVLPFLEELTSKVVVTTREPGGNPLAEAVRDLLKEQQEPAIDARTEVLLLAASRREHVVQTILPALNDGVVVVSDRYLDSSLAYQGGGRGLGMQAVQAINDYAIENPETGQAVEPGLTIYMDLPVEIGLERVFKHRTGKIDRMDRENLDFHRRVRESYLELAAQNPERIKTVNANQPADKVLEDVKAILLENWR
ncbi:Thymidylate kinase (Tmk) [Fructobacillus fructosus]|uniref:dTMP kinase n=1 Tax=Fructobacillus fructosus TaxID=1631 RepID=UPI00021954C2|nr:dTMP kinase [Fructobacillus fructosus]KRN52416.1 thymidylate kinase [Fructobacillus fructosus KCTC 3544]GAP01736.1 thymidylate kinase [Fructobacillus fructosus]CAK1239530.1 Thymidylate kinase (Tmk) [Fructobacillus fructosus]